MFHNILQTYQKVVHLIQSEQLSINDDLEKIVLLSSLDRLAYVDGRKKARMYDIDFWSPLLKTMSPIDIQHMLDINNLYSDSQRFPDFLFKTYLINNQLSGGEILELKDSTSTSIASFNSTLPVEYKTLDEICYLSKIVCKISEKYDPNSNNENWKFFKRKCFYLIRTNKNRRNVKISFVDGSFFETVPLKTLIKQMFLNVFNRHIEYHNLQDEDIINYTKKGISYIDNQHLIAFSQTITNASIRPRLRIMAEIKTEGNPHSRNYEIPDNSINLIIKNDESFPQIKNQLNSFDKKIITHSFNGEFVVFSYVV